MGVADFAQRDTAAASFLSQGVTFTVYDDDGERADFPFDRSRALFQRANGTLIRRLINTTAPALPATSITGKASCARV